MKSFALSALLACVATARDQHASLAQLMQLHDEMVAKLDEPNNEVDHNKGLFDRLLGDEEDVSVKVDAESQSKGKDPARADDPKKEKHD